jgi:hypothetical protein
MKILYGCTRFVILTKNYVIKIPQFKYEWRHFLLGLLANMQEVAFSKIEDDRFCPVFFSLPGGCMVIMPRCKEISREEFYDLDVIRFWPDKSEDYHPDNMCKRVNFNVPVENREDSFGWYNNKIVAIDYGS